MNCVPRCSMSLPIAAALLGMVSAGVPAEALTTAATVVVAGSGSNLASARVLAEAFRRVRPDVRIEIPPSLGSSGAVKAVAAGAITIGLVSRPLRDAEASAGVTLVPYARAVIVLAAHPSVPDDTIALADVVEIYRGAKTQWRDGRDIVVLTREPGDSSIGVLERQVPGFQDAYADSQRARRWTTLHTDKDMNHAIARTAHAFGLSDLGTIVTERLPVKVLRVDGVRASIDDAANGRYPLVKPLAFVVRQAALVEPARAFIAFAASREGAAVLRAAGYLPAR